MPKFICKNPDCEGVGQTEYIARVMFVWNEKTEKLEASEAACSVCGKQREVVREEGPIEVPWFKPENAKNHNNKTIKKYDYDHDAANASRAKLSDGSDIS
jgi:hypothetical protein